MSAGAPGELPVVVLMTSNGAGMGHLTRLAAVAAAALQGRGFTAVLLSMSSALPVVAAAIPAAARAEYCPGPTSGWMPVDVWHRYLSRRLVALVREVGASTVVFDGTSPYPGLLAARRALPDLHLVWSRRGMWRPDASRAPLRSTGYFDEVVEPGDLAAAADRGPTAGLTDVTRIAPVTVLETLGLPGAPTAMPRSAARDALGLDPDRPAMLVTLGAGHINDPSAAIAAAAAAVLTDPSWQVALTRAPLALRDLPEAVRSRVTVLDRVFPLAAVLSAFDAAVSAAGYNAAHELVLSGVPTLLVPNAATSTDDQVSRGRYLAARGWALIAAEHDRVAITGAVAELLDAGVRADLREAVSGLHRPTGASALAAAATRVAAAAAPRPLPRDRYVAVRGASAQVRRLVGEPTWERARRLAGAPPRPPAARPTPVTQTLGVVPDGMRRLVVTSDLADVTGSADTVVEHVLAGSSQEYLRQRRQIITATYDGARL